jgi:hypothetical protein
MDRFRWSRCRKPLCCPTAAVYPAFCNMERRLAHILLRQLIQYGLTAIASPQKNHLVSPESINRYPPRSQKMQFGLLQRTSRRISLGCSDALYAWFVAISIPIDWSKYMSFPRISETNISAGCHVLFGTGGLLSRYNCQVLIFQLLSPIARGNHGEITHHARLKTFVTVANKISLNMSPSVCSNFFSEAGST